MQDDAPPPLSILLVDPNAGASAHTRTMLEAAGHSVIFVHDWTAAETRLTLHHVEAVVMCITTRGIGRASAPERLRAAAPRNAALPLLGLSPGTDHLAPAEALAAGFDAVISRPFGAEALAAALREAVRRRTPPMLLDADQRAALRETHGPAALAALDAAAMETAARLLAPILADGGTAEAIAAAAEEVAAAMQGIGAVHAAAAVREVGAQAGLGRRAVRPAMATLTSTRVALRRDRMTAAIRDPIWAASDIAPGDTT
jgi:CheY-like chemotaxis protein